MSDQSPVNSSKQLILGLNDKPSGGVILSSAWHLAAIAASILTAPLLLARAIGLDDLQTVYVINASLGVSGIATFIQVYKFGWLGSGLLSVQGTSFAFIGAMAYASSMLKESMQIDEVVGVLLGTSMVGAILVVLASFFLTQIRKVITPTVTGVTIFLAGSIAAIVCANQFDERLLFCIRYAGESDRSCGSRDYTVSHNLPCQQREHMVPVAKYSQRALDWVPGCCVFW